MQERAGKNAWISDFQELSLKITSNLFCDWIDYNLNRGVPISSKEGFRFKGFILSFSLSKSNDQ
jgi:hypothetical protein